MILIDHPAAVKFGEVIRNSGVRRHLALSFVSARIQRFPQELLRWEHGHVDRLPALDPLRALSRVLGVPLRELLDLLGMRTESEARDDGGVK